MAQVVIEGVFMGSNIKTTEFEGNKKTNVILDLYQPNSELSNKAVQLKTDDISFYDVLSKNYATGSLIKVLASVNAYKNQAYFKLLDLVE